MSNHYLKSNHFLKHLNKNDDKDFRKNILNYDLNKGHRIKSERFHFVKDFSQSFLAQYLKQLVIK
jgi:hypothetical protein